MSGRKSIARAASASANGTPARRLQSQRPAARSAGAAIAQQVALASVPIIAAAPARARKAAKGRKRKNRSPSPSSSSEDSADDASAGEHSDTSASSRPKRGRAQFDLSQPGAEPQRQPQATLQHPSCQACLSPILGPLLSGTFCPACKLFPSFAFDHPMNQRRFSEACAPSSAQQSPAAAAGAAATVGVSVDSSSSMGQSTAAPKLSAFETELKRLADLAHTPRELYTRAAPMDHSAALARMLNHTYKGAMFAKQSEHLTQLIRSGQFRQLPLALPRRNTDVLAEEEREAKRGRQALRINALDNTITLGGSEVHARDASSLSLRDFMQVLVFAVIPSLIDRPAALMEWALLARSALAIDEEKGWHAASAYVRNHLQRCAANGADVGCFDKALWEDIRADLLVTDDTTHTAGRSLAPSQTSRSGAGSGTRSGAPAARPAHASSALFGSDVVKTGFCRDWNGISQGRGFCTREGCSFKHECCWTACQGGAAHRAVDCSRKPPGSAAAHDRGARAADGRK